MPLYIGGTQSSVKLLCLNTSPLMVSYKQQQGPDLHVWGSGNLLQTLIQHDLVDTFWLMIYPITLGTGKRLFAEGTILAKYEVTESEVAPNGVIVVNYERTHEPLQAA